jgi:hypothetical protein
MLGVKSGRLNAVLLFLNQTPGKIRRIWHINQMVFTPKGEEVLRAEIMALGFNEEDHADTIDSLVAMRLKDEKMKASLHDQKTKALKEAKDFKDAKEFYKQGGKPKGVPKEEPKKETPEAKEDVRLIVAKEMFLAQGGSNTELRQIDKIMKATGKSFWDAQKDSLYVAFQEKQEREDISRSSQLPPSRGGSPKAKEQDEFEKKFSGSNHPRFQNLQEKLKK